MFSIPTWILIGFVVFVSLQSVLIGSLLVQRARLQRAEEDARRSENELRASYTRQRDLAVRLISAQEGERSRIARELHADVGQELALLCIDLQQLSERLPARRDHLQARTRELFDRAAAISTSVHDLSHRLHPLKLELMGLVSSIGDLRRRLADQHHIVINFTHQGVPAAIPREVALCLFRITQEGLRNAIKHGAAEEVRVYLRGAPAGLHLTIADDGAGFEADPRREGLGLISMRERLDSIGGTMTIRSKPGEGTRLEVVAPLARADRIARSVAG